MDWNCSEISENYSKNSYDIIPNDMKFESILQPVLAMIQHKLKGNYLYAEEYLIKFLQQKRTKVETEDILDLSKHMSACVAHLYIILISMILSFMLGFPLAFCLKTCYKKISNPNKYKYWLFAQSVLFAGAMVFLFIGSATNWNIAIRSQRYLDRFPKEYTNVIKTLNQTKFHFDGNCKKLHSTVDSNLMKIANLTFNIYNDIVNMIDAKTSAEYLSSLEKFNNSVYNLEQVFDSIGFMNVDHKPTSRLVNIIEELHFETKRISQYFSATFLHTNDAMVAMKMTMPDIVFPRNYVYPDWEEFYYDITITLAVLFPNMNSTIRFVDILKRNLKNIHDKNMENVIQQIQRIQDFISSKCATISEAIGLVNPERIENNTLTKASLKLDELTSYSLFSRNCTTDFLKLKTWIFLFPSIYGFVVLFSFIIAFIGAYKEIYTTTSGKIVNGTYTVIIFKVAIRISITFLWLILLIASILYFIHIPTVVICGTLKKDKLTDRYLDRPYWKNQTWIMSKLNKYLPHAKKPITIKNILMKCRQNKTIIRSFNLDEHIDKNYSFSSKEETKEKYAAVIRRQTTTNFNDVMNYINFTNFWMDTMFISEVQNGLNRTENGINFLQQMILHMNLTQNHLFENNVVHIRLLIEQLKNLLEEFVKAKLLVQVVRNDLLELKIINDRLENITKNDLYVDVDIYLNNVTEHIKCFHENTEMFIKHSLLYEFGNCDFLPYIYDKLKWFVCDYGLELMNCLWLSLAIIGFSIIIATILACRIACYVRGTYKIHNRYLLNSQRYSGKQTAIVNQMDPMLGFRK